MIICGIDPGLEQTGYGVIEAAGNVLRVVDAGLINSPPTDPLPERLLQIHQGLVSLLDEHTIDMIAVEQLYSHYGHPRTAILMGHARGVILLAALQHSISVTSLAATQIKKALTGNGRASKVQIQHAVTVRLNLPALVAPNDVADALAAAICCWEHTRSVKL